MYQMYINPCCYIYILFKKIICHCTINRLLKKWTLRVEENYKQKTTISQNLFVCGINV